MDVHVWFSLPSEECIMKLLIVNGKLAHFWSNLKKKQKQIRNDISMLFYTIPFLLSSVSAISVPPSPQVLVSFP